MLIPGILTAIGALALVIGLWGRRVGTEVRCRKCLFSLEGLTSPAVCPECGRDVTGAKATRRGMRRRSGMVIVVALVMVLGGASWLGRSTYTLFTAPGWADRVPEWWLVEVEGRWAEGQRLADAIGAAPLRHRRGQLSDDLRTRLSDILFHRVRSSLPVDPLGVGQAAALEEIAEWSTREKPERVAELIALMLCFELKPQFDATRPREPLRLTTTFIPRRWLIAYTWRAVDALGEDAGLSGEGWIGEQSLSAIPTRLREPVGLATRSHWRVEIYRSGIARPPVYEFDVPWPGAGWKDFYPAREGQ